MRNTLKTYILKIVASYHMLNMMYRILFNKKILWEDKPNWVVQVLAHPIPSLEIRRVAADEEELQTLSTFVNTANKELVKRDLRSYDLFN